MNTNDEIDLKNLFKVIWDGKIKIFSISIISFLIGYVYYIQLPTNYSNQIVISKVGNYELFEYSSINKLMINLIGTEPSAQVDTSKKGESTPLAQIVLDKYIEELKDFEEYLFNIKKTTKAQKSIENLSTENQQIKLFKFINLLKIREKKINRDEDIEEYNLIFQWHDPDEALKILGDTLIMTSNTLKKKISNELAKNLELHKNINLAKDKKRLDYLKEQSAIARELSIVDNQIENINLSPQSSLSLSINTADIAYYLRGYKAIDKEIVLIQNRKYDYFKSLEQDLENFKNKDFNFVNYNIYTMESKLLKNKKIILIISILAGLIMSTIFVLISNAFNQRNSD